MTYGMRHLPSGQAVNHNAGCHNQQGRVRGIFFLVILCDRISDRRNLFPDLMKSMAFIFLKTEVLNRIRRSGGKQYVRLPELYLIIRMLHLTGLKEWRSAHRCRELSSLMRMLKQSDLQ